MSYEEKETDVNIAIDMVAIAHQKSRDILCLLSADGDFVPILQYIGKSFRDISVISIFPPNRRNSRFSQIKGAMDIRLHTMDTKSLDQYLLPDKVRFRSRTITRPEAYAPPAM